MTSCRTVVLDCIRFGLVYCTQNWRKGWNDVSQKRSCEINDFVPTWQSVCRVFTNGRSLADGQQYDYGEDLGVTAVALYDYQAGEAEESLSFSRAPNDKNHHFNRQNGFVWKGRVSQFLNDFNQNPWWVIPGQLTRNPELFPVQFMDVKTSTKFLGLSEVWPSELNFSILVIL